MSNRHPTANASQRARRAKLARVDYYPSPEALAIMEAKRGHRYPLTIASGILDAIVLEWDWLVKNQPESNAPMSAQRAPGISGRNARANDSDSFRAAMLDGATKPRTERTEAKCGARTKAGPPCKGRALPRTKRCKWHGGMSTGPKTPEGKARALANLRQGRTRGEA